MSYLIPPRTDKDLRWYGIDLDGCLAEPIWPEPGVGDPIWKNVEKMKRVHEAGYKIMIHSSRHWSDYETIRGWLIQHDLDKYVREIHLGKPLYKKYVDDKAVNSEEETWL